MSRYNTPLRYPGGKQKLSPFVVELLQANDLVGGDYVEPYAGGAGVAMELLLGGWVQRVHLNDVCRGVFSFWHSVLNESVALCRKVNAASLTVTEWRRQREILMRAEEFDALEVGFAMFYLNRCNRSGIARGGLIGGLAQQGEWKMDARFNRKELVRRIEAIASRKARITLHNSDAEVFLNRHVSRLPHGTLVYCDPPYFAKSDRLYLNRYTPEDHARIAKMIQRKLRHPWVVSYDNAPEIKAHYSRCRSFEYALQYNAAKAYKGTEIFFLGKGVRLPKRSTVECIDFALRNR